MTFADGDARAVMRPVLQELRWRGCVAVQWLAPKLASRLSSALTAS
jgi:hypothetical protein